MGVRAIILALVLCYVVGVFGDIATASASISYSSELPIGPVMFTPTPVFASVTHVSTSATSTTAVLAECDDMVYPTFPLMPWMHATATHCQLLTITVISTQVNVTTSTTTATVTEAPSIVTKTLSLQSTGFSTITAMCALNNGLAAPCTTAVLSPTHTSASAVNLNPFYWIAKAIEGFHMWLSKLFQRAEVEVPKVGNPV